MNAGAIPHQRQTAYARGLEDGRMERAHWLPLGISIGVAIGGGLGLLLLLIKGCF